MLLGFAAATAPRILRIGMRADRDADPHGTTTAAYAGLPVRYPSAQKRVS